MVANWYDLEKIKENKTFASSYFPNHAARLSIITAMTTMERKQTACHDLSAWHVSKRVSIFGFGIVMAYFEQQQHTDPIYLFIFVSKRYGIAPQNKSNLERCWTPFSIG